MYGIWLSLSIDSFSFIVGYEMVKLIEGLSLIFLKRISI